MSGRTKRNLQHVQFTSITKGDDLPPVKRPRLVRQATPHGKKSIEKIPQKEEEEEEEEADDDHDQDEDDEQEDQSDDVEGDEEEEQEQKIAPTKASKSTKTSTTKTTSSSPSVKPTTSSSPNIKPTSSSPTMKPTTTSPKIQPSTSSTSTLITPSSLPPVIPSSAATVPRKVIILMIKSSLETIKTKRGYELVSADTHKSILQKLNKDPSAYRPDITHQCLLTLLDSPLNKAGHLQVYIQTEKNVLIEVNPALRVPRTFRRFAGLMVQLLHKLKIRASDGSDVLLKVIKNPITQHLPAGCFKFGTSVTGELVHFPSFASTLPSTDPIVLVVGAHASGPAQVDWVAKNIAISQYGLSASVALGRICNAFENLWQIL